MSARLKNISPKSRKRLKKTAIVLFVILLFFAALGVFIGFFYENTVKHIIISELNKRLNTEIIVENIEKDIQFSVFRDFPYASVTFYNVTMLDAIKTKSNRDNLLKAKSVSLQFSIVDLISKNYRIKRIEAQKGTIHVKIYKDRSDNYHFWKSSTDTIREQKFSLNLEKILLKEMILTYDDYGLDQKYSGFAQDLILKGKFFDNEYTLFIDGSLYVDVIRSKKDVYLSKKNTRLDAELFVNTKQKQIFFKEGGIKIGKMPFEITGGINYYRQPVVLDLQVKSPQLSLQQFINELPPVAKNIFSDYDCKGKMSFVVQIKGETGNEIHPMINAEVKLSEGTIINKKNKIALHHVVFQAKYTNGKERKKETSLLTISGFSSKLNEGSLSGDFQMYNFKKPEIALSISASMDLKDVFGFLKTDSIKSATGKIVTKASIKGVIQNFDGITVKDFITSSAEGTLDLQDAEIVFANEKHRFSNLNGHFEFNNNDIVSKNFRGSYLSSDFTLIGEFRNILPFVFLKNKDLRINAVLESNFIDLGEILQKNTNKNDTVYTLILPENIDFALTLKVKQFVFKRFSATNVNGKILLKDKQVIASNVAMNAMDGSLLFSGLIDGNTKGKLLISCDANIKKVNVRKLFYEMENFNQQGLQDKNIQGNVTADIQFASVWTTDLKVEKPTIYAHANITIENGALINYEPLSGLSPYLKNRDLSNVTFSTLKNTIQIKDQTITIPDMEINSSAINFNINGTHGFDQSIDYHISVLISQLRGSDKNKNNQVEDIGQIADDGLHKEKYFFRITGTVDKPVYHKLDKEAIKTNIKTNISKEKESLKEILNREFGWFKKDTTANKNPKEKTKEKYDFKVEWEDE